MKVRTVSVIAMAIAFMGLCVPASDAQRRTNGTFVGTPQAQNQPQRPTPAPFPSPVIGPMGNPIGPMGNPVAPIVPFVRFSDPTPTVVIPEREIHLRTPGYNRRGRDGRDVVYVPVPVPTSYYPVYDYPYYTEPPQVPATVPGQLPGVRPVAGAFNATPNAPAPAAPASSFVGQPDPGYNPEPRMIVNEPRPNRVVTAPAVGTPRADVIASLGQPWGTIHSRGQETLYFDGLTVAFGTDGRVVSAR